MARWMGRLGPRLGLAWPLAGQRPIQLPPALGAARLGLRARLVLARLRGARLAGVGPRVLGRVWGLAWVALGLGSLVVLAPVFPFDIFSMTRSVFTVSVKFVQDER